MTDHRDDDAPGDRVRKAMAGKRAPDRKVVDGGASAPRQARGDGGRKRAAKAGAPEEEPFALYGADAPAPPPHDAPPDGNGAPGDEFLPPDATPEDLDRARRCMPLDQNDRDNARRLIIWFGEDLMYVGGIGWLTWRGTHWQADDGDLAARLMAQSVVDKIKLECAFIVATPAQSRLIAAAEAVRRRPEDDWTPTERDLVFKRLPEALKKIAMKVSRRHDFAVTSGNTAKTGAMLEQARSLKVIDIDRLDADPLKVSVRNGTLHFVRREREDSDPSDPGFEWAVEFRPHDRADRITKLADVTYDPDAACPNFMKFLDRMQPDAGEVAQLRVVHGYAVLIGHNDAQRVIYHFGTGANGKSVFMETIGRLAGMLRATVSPDTLSGDTGRQGSQANPDIARLHNVPFVTIEELPANQPLKENLIKALSGGAKILARHLNRDFFEFTPKFTAVLSGNDLPQVSGSDYGVTRRLLIIEWGVTVPMEERREFGDMLATFDAERPGILNWLIQGALDYLQYGLDQFITPKTRAFNEDYREERDPVGNFVRAHVRKAAGQRTAAGEMYKAYLGWCERNAVKAWTQTAFGRVLTKQGYDKARGASVYYVDTELFDLPVAGATAPANPPDDPGWMP